MLCKKPQNVVVLILFIFIPIHPNSLYYHIFKKTYGASSGEKMLIDMEKVIEQYNEDQHDLCATMERTEDGQTIVALCTPLMKRVHKMVEHSAEMVFIDSSGNCDRHNTRIFVLLTHSTAGGLPLGIIMTTSESQSTIVAGLNLLKTILPDEGFAGRESHGPRIFITDDCLSLRQALHSVYPEASLLLCVFHLMQAMWRWLWDSHNGIPKKDRPYLLQSFKRMVYAETSGELNNCYDAFCHDAIAQQYPKCVDHLGKIYERRQAWAICLRSDLPTRGNHTNNFVESAMKIVKEKVLHRLKAYNVTQLMHFLMTRLEDYYVRRLTDVANNRMTSSRSKFNLKKNDVDCDKITKVGAYIINTNKI